MPEKYDRVTETFDIERNKQQEPMIIVEGSERAFTLTELRQHLRTLMKFQEEQPDFEALTIIHAALRTTRLSVNEVLQADCIGFGKLVPKANRADLIRTFKLDKPVSSLKLKPGTFNQLNQQGLQTIGQLLTVTCNPSYDRWEEIITALNEVGIIWPSKDQATLAAIRQTMEEILPQSMNVQEINAKQLDRPIGVLSWTKRARHYLEDHTPGITIGQLLCMSDKDVIKVKNLGRKTVAEIKAVLLSSLGINWPLNESARNQLTKKLADKDSH